MLKIDLSEYRKLKASGDILVRGDADKISLTVKQFDQQTGKQKPAIAVTMDKESLVRQIAVLRKNANELEALVNDSDKAVKPVDLSAVGIKPKGEVTDLSEEVVVNG